MGVATTKPHPTYDVAHRAPLLKYFAITTDGTVMYTKLITLATTDVKYRVKLVYKEKCPTPKETIFFQRRDNLCSSGPVLSLEAVPTRPV